MTVTGASKGLFVSVVFHGDYETHKIEVILASVSNFIDMNYAGHCMMIANDLGFTLTWLSSLAVPNCGIAVVDYR